MNNLRQISSAADQYFIESGLTTVTVAALVSDGWLRDEPAAVAGETYPTDVTAATSTLSVTTSAGKTVEFQRMAAP